MPLFLFLGTGRGPATSLAVLPKETNWGHKEARVRQVLSSAADIETKKMGTVSCSTCKISPGADAETNWGHKEARVRQVLSSAADIETKKMEKPYLVLVISTKEIVSRFTMNIIGSCAFGLDCNTFIEESSPFRKYGQKFFALDKYRMMIRLFMLVFPNACNKMGVMIRPPDVSDFFLKVVKGTVDYREKNNCSRKDFMQLLMDIKNDKLRDNSSLTLEEIAAQCFVFFIAGFETSASTMTFALYELSRNQKMQDKVRREINTVLAKYEDRITYEAIQEMVYMEMVVNETLRKYPPAPQITRQCVKDYKIPNEDVTIEKGTMVFIPILAVHHDEEYYPEPEKFDPERFTQENKGKRHPYAHIPFGEGPRICIGARFGIMQFKVGLTSLLKNYKFTVNKTTIEPLKISAQASVLAADGEIWLNVKKI
ncbi:hypothetical protein Zmor_014367 [Zophobas morio]|uniref:Cytochrome P450 n=1 Tax=Zophobas morio TaxID=2755281 RepID=A0AA38IHA1_9CUCU|nr:hypothetical protein Zmor_014367 [Zophobas morio]